METLQSQLEALPLIGTLFSGGFLYAALRIAAIVVVIIVGKKLLTRVFREHPKETSDPLEPQDEEGRTVADLIKLGEHEKAGDLCRELGDLNRAVRYYEMARCWEKAGHVAGQLGQHVKAGLCYERAKNYHLAFDCYLRVGKKAEADRAAIVSGDVALISRAAKNRVDSQEHLRAAELYYRAGMFGEAERQYLLVPVEGMARAIRMYVQAYQKSSSVNPDSKTSRKLAMRAVELLRRTNRTEDANKLLKRAGLSSPESRPTPSPPALRPSIQPLVTGRSSLIADLALESPIESADGFLFPSDLSMSEDSPRPPSIVSRDAAPPPPNPELEQESDVAEGRQTRYEILEELGRGGMAVVYKARDITLDRVVALKFLLTKIQHGDVFRELFQREARAAAALNHPSITTIYDVGEIDGRPFISMEYIEGENLGSSLASGSLTVTRALEIGTQLARALEYAHRRKVIHRDIKPTNVMFDAEGRVKLVDFGVAKLLSDGPSKASRFIGTPTFMAPEQLAGEEMDGRSDIFALGVLLYRILTGKKPFKGMQRNDDVRPITSLAPWVPLIAERVVHRAIASDPDKRYQTAGEMADELDVALDEARELEGDRTVWDEA